MHPIIIQPPSLDNVIPVLVAVVVGLVLFVLGRWSAARKYARAIRANHDESAPTPKAPNFPLNDVDPCPRPIRSDPSDIVFELIDITFESDVEPYDSASATQRFSRVG
jgi:hypothetical protein